MEKYLSIIVIILSLAFVLNFWHPATVLGDDAPQQSQTLPSFQPIHTDSRFTEKLQEETEIILKKTVYQDDPEVEAGTDTVLNEGEDGKKVTIVKITFADGEEYSRETVSTETTPAKDKKISRGTKIVWKTLDTPDGEIRYWKKMRVYATHYDQHCLGCNEWTAIGMRAGKGVIAVDPKVIKMRSKVYVPGYGMAIAGDTGGAIKGNIIDLGFDDARTAGWSARFVDIYLL
ncbi:MAG: G5 domain-containing protein [Candidatus Daviesbacteria bacterium]|nr:G5 domain-containing protein [Candidatus Daviesbacteria bacterium]